MFCAVVKFSVMAIQGEGVASNGNCLARTPLSDLFKGKLSGFRAFVFVVLPNSKLKKQASGRFLFRTRGS